jgi:phosphatidylserine/phosphatidylglycerophosphate/cardiolipin synthase-like enzyme
MHHKFVVIDEQEVWTGSMNFTVSGTYRNNNNLVQLRSAEVAALYATEFEEMYVLDRYGRLSEADPYFAPIQVDNLRIEVLFAPDQPISPRLVELLEQANQSIQLMAFNLTLDPIADALVAATVRGVKVEGVIEADQADNQGSDIERLLADGIEIVHDGNPRKMHHKVIIIDRAIVITGSYNFSRSAEEQNDENLLIIYSPEMAELYLIEFTRLRDEGLH